MPPDSPTLNDAQSRALRCVAGMMIPPDPGHGMPGADDAPIIADIVASLGRDIAAVQRALGQLDALAGGDFASASEATRQAAAARLRSEFAPQAMVLVEVTVRCYYRDDRVMRAIGMEPRPPYPKGFEVERGDYSLLDPVRARGRIWRDAP